MDGRFNTIAGWVLGAGIVLLGANLVTDEIFKAERPETMGYPIDGVEEEGEGGAAAEQPIAHYPADRRRRPRRGRVPQVQRPATMPIRAAPTALGPNLWGTMGDDRSAMRRLRLFRRAALAWRQLGLGDDERVAAQSPRNFARARR